MSEQLQSDFDKIVKSLKISKSGGPELALELEKKGYESFN